MFFKYKRILNKNKLTGFTIMELTVTISLVVLMVTLSTVSYRRANKRAELILATQQTANLVRLAQTYAASSKIVKDNPAFNIWGVYFDKSESQKIILFVDENKDGLYQPVEKNKEVLLPPQVKIKDFYYNERNAPLSGSQQVSVTYLPPDPKVRFCQSGSGSCGVDWVNDWSEPWDDLYVILVDEVNQSTKDIHINFFGLIDAR